MNNNLNISIPTDVILEWQNGINNGIAANQWWKLLTKQQQKFLLEAGFLFFQKQKIKQSQLESESLIPSLTKLARNVGAIELSQYDNNHVLLSGKIERDLYGVKGRCYSQSPEFIGAVCEEFLGGYSGESMAHKHGQHTVDVICFALNALPGITASPTPPNSVADVGLRWDVIIKWNDYYFPVQVKSSLQGINTALETGSLGNYAQEKIDQLCSDYYKKGEKFIKELNRCSPEVRQEKKADYKSLQENISELMRKYKQTAPLYIWASQNRETVRLLVELFANSFKIENNLKQYQDEAVAAYIEKYQNSFELTMRTKMQTTMRTKMQTTMRTMYESQTKINDQKKEKAEQIIQVLKEQIQGKQKRIRNRKARKRPVVIEHTQALKLAEDALKHIQELIEGQMKWQWYRDQTLFNQTEKLRNLDKETNSPMLQQTEELFKLIQDFTEIQEIEFDTVDMTEFGINAIL